MEKRNGATPKEVIDQQRRIQEAREAAEILARAGVLKGPISVNGRTVVEPPMNHATTDRFAHVTVFSPVDQSTIPQINGRRIDIWTGMDAVRRFEPIQEPKFEPPKWWER